MTARFSNAYIQRHFFLWFILLVFAFPIGCATWDDDAEVQPWIPGRQAQVESRQTESRPAVPPPPPSQSKPVQSKQDTTSPSPPPAPKQPTVQSPPPSQVEAPDTPRLLRVLTYNIHHGAGMDERLDLNRIADVIASVQPDLVSLQEVDRGVGRTHNLDQAANLGTLTGMYAAFGKARNYGDGDYGVAILSRHRILDVANHPLPSGGGRETRTALEIEVYIDGIGKVRFVATHLQHNSLPDRVAQMDTLNALFVQSNNQPVIIAGDLNESPQTPLMSKMNEQWLISGYEEMAPTFPANRPSVMIDYVLYRPLDHWRVVQTRVLDESVASDHRPVLSIVQWQPPEN